MLNLNIKISKLTVLLLSFATVGFMLLMHWENMYNTQLIQGSYDVIERTPTWKANQSRLMGPAILKLLTLFGLSKWWALRIFALFFITFNNFLLAKVFSLTTDSKFHILNSLLIFNTLFIISQDVWLFVWDLIDISFFIFYGLVILKNEYLKYLIVINFFHIFNRETAMIMAAFFIFIIYLNKNKNINELFKDKVVFGLVFNFIFGIIYTYFSRKLLFIRQSELTGGGQDLTNTFLGGNWVTPLHNYYTLFNGENVSNALILLSVFSAVFLIIKNYKNFSSVEKLLSIATIINILPVFIFGIFIETRQYFPSLVMITFLIFSTSNKEEAKE